MHIRVIKYLGRILGNVELRYMRNAWSGQDEEVPKAGSSRKTVILALNSVIVGIISDVEGPSDS